MAYHTSISRFAGGGSFGINNPMSDEDINRVAPSVFAVEKHHSRSERFAYIPTVDILNGLRKQGFVVVNAAQGRTRISGKANFTKHLLRFQHPDYKAGGTRLLGGVAPQALLMNSHDGSSSYRIMAGMFRGICKNSSVVMEDGATDVKVLHRGNIVQDVIEGTFSVIDEGRNRVTAATGWADVPLNTDERMVLAEAAHTLRFGDSEGVTNTPIEPRQLLVPHRFEDHGTDLWTTYNVMQENCIRGGMTGVAHYNGQRPTRRVTTKEIKGIDQDVRLNRALWKLAARMDELLKGKVAA